MKKKKTTWGSDDGYEEVPDTAGKICNGVYLKKNKDGQCEAVRIRFAWGGDLEVTLLP